MMKYTKSLIETEQKELLSLRNQLANLQFEIAEEEKENAKQLDEAKRKSEIRKKLKREYEERRKIYHDIQFEKSQIQEVIKRVIDQRSEIRSNHAAMLHSLENDS